MEIRCFIVKKINYCIILNVAMAKKLLFITFCFFYFSFFFSCKPKQVITDKDINKSNKYNYVYDTELSKNDRKNFAKILNVEAEEITNEKLYIFIKSWKETTYLYGGDSKNGVDCSALMQHLYKFVYNVNLPRTSTEMGFDKRIKLFRKMKDLKEGDLVFFRMNNEKIISHVGVYLKNYMFFSAASTEGCSIASLKKPYWGNKFVGGGRLKN
jgi:cell wall-associated NlpC family hydrolase